MFVNNFKMIFRILLAALFSLTIVSALARKEDVTDEISRKRRANRDDCRNAIGCSTVPNKKTRQCQDNRDCRKREVCHDLLKICFIEQTARNKMKLKRTKTKTCKVDADCRHNQTCHAFFATCVNKLRIQTTAVPKTTSVQVCRENSDCPQTQYCHDFFKMCLPNLMNYLESTSSSTHLGCKSASDCKNGEFCHNLTSLCLPMPTDAPASSSPKTLYPCSLHADCKVNEICHFLTRRQERNKEVGKKDPSTAIGVCIDGTDKGTPKKRTRVATLNCSQSSECGSGRCCLSDMGMCSHYRTLGQLCVAQEVPFSCPCLPGLTCVSRKRPMRLRRLEKKLKLATERMKNLGLHLNKSTEYKVGKCANVSD